MALPTFDCLTSPASFLVDAANRICHVDDATGVHVITVVSALAAVALGTLGLMRRQSRLVKIAAAWALLWMVPGLLVTLFGRADSPTRARALAKHVRARMTAFEQAGRGFACVDIERDECVACQPLAQFVYRACRPPPIPFTGIEGKVVFAAGAFDGGACVRKGSVITCSPP